MAALLVLAVAVVLVVRFVDRTGTAEPALTPAPAPSTPAASSPTDQPAPSTPVLPQSEAVPVDDLLLSMETDGATRIFRTGAQQPAPLVPLVEASGTNVFPVLSPDRRTLGYLRFLDDSGRRRELRVAAADGSGDRPLFATVPPACAARTSRPAWNPVRPDELALVCLDAEGRATMFLVGTDGTLRREIPLPGKAAGDPTFSNDGTRLAFWAAPDASFNGGDLYVMDASGQGEATRLTRATRDSEYADPAFSPDGTELAFRKRDAGRGAGGDLNVYVMKADGSGKQRRLVEGKGSSEQDPAWSPDGRRLVYMSDARTSAVGGGRVTRIWVVDRDGSGARPLLTEGSPGPQGSVLWTRR